MATRRRLGRTRWTWTRRSVALAAGVALFGAAALVGGSPAMAAPASATGPALAVEPAAPVAPELRAEVAAAEESRIQALLMLPTLTRLGDDPDEVVGQLQAYAREVQDEVEVALEQQAETRGDVAVRNRFWITNMLLVEFTADSSRLDALAATPGVDRVLPNFTMSLPEPEVESAAEPGVAIVDGRITWGLDRIGAERVWQELGLDGSGVRVVTLDTGVAIDHPDLAGKMATDDPTDPTYPGGWMEFDASGNPVASAPHDSASHGTHVSGTIHGGDTSGVAIGGAPGAELAHGLVIPTGTGTFAQVTAGMQWAIAPTDASGDPAGRPADVVNMSLGAPSYVAEMIAPTRAIVAAGAFPAFAIGNEDLFGSCGVGSSSPGNVYDAVGIGATDVDENVADFSCGNVVNKSSWTNPPADWPDSYVTPDLSAPGDQVWSATPAGGYRYASGTSMATPHAAATAALMRQGAPELTVDQLRGTLVDTAFWEDRYADAPPDPRYGHGRIDAYAAVSQVALDSGITGQVTDAGSGTPLADVAVSVTPTGNTVRTDSDGRYTVRLPAGSYELTGSTFGYEPATVTGVTVADEVFTEVDIPLTAQPTGTIAGTASLDESGHGIPGVEISIAGVPAGYSDVTDVDGRYAIEIPIGTYQVSAAHPQFVAPAPASVTVVAGETAAADFVLSPPPPTVAIVGDYGDKYVDEVFAPRGIETVRYDWPDLVRAAEHSLVILTYGATNDYDAERFEAFLGATDVSGAGVIFTDHAFGPGSGIRQLSQHTGQPAATGSSSGGSGVSESFYQVTAEHPIFDGFAVGDRIALDTSTQAKWIAWFDGYSGDGRQTIADMGRTDATGVYGGGIGVDQRPSNRHVLMSTHGASVTRGPADWTTEATELFLNAVNWAARPAEPGTPYFAVHNLRVTPDVVKSEEAVQVRVQVKNVGGTTGPYQAVLRINGADEATTTVTLASGASREITWTVRREELGQYTVEVAYLSGSFRVRPPRVSLTARTVDAPDTDPGPLAGATVELIHDGAVLPVGTTAADGALTFETPAAIGRYTLVVRRPAVDGSDAYLLHRVITIIDDDEVLFAPRILASGTVTAAYQQDFAARVTLAAELVDAGHEALTYLRPATTAPWSYAYEPGRVVVSLDHYEAVNVHRVTRLERDWWLPSEIIPDLAWIDPYDETFAFGGEARVRLAANAPAAPTVEVDWDVTDAHGHPFATVRATDVRPFLDLPGVLTLEDVLGAVRAEAPNEQLPILRLSAPDGTALRAGSIGWAAQPYHFDLDEVTAGAYRLSLELATGAYSGDIAAETSLTLVEATELTATYPAQARLGGWLRYDLRLRHPGDADLGTAEWTVTVAAEAGLRAQDVVLQLRGDDGWERVPLTADGGRLVGTVLADVAVTAGLDETWQLRAQIRRPGTVTIADHVRGEQVDLSTSGTVRISRRVSSAVELR